MRFFLTKTNRFYSFVIHHHILTLYALSVGIMASIMIAWFFGCYRLCDHAINRLQKQSDEQENSIQSISALQKKRNQLRESVQRLKQQAMAIDQRIQQHSALMPIIIDVAQHIGIRIEQCTATPVRTKKKDSHQTVCCSFAAPFTQIIAFFDHLSTQKIPIMCTELSIQQRDATCDVRCVWQLYQVVREKEEQA